MRASAIVADGVYTDWTLTSWRRVIAIHDLHVVYSTGGDHNRICSRKTFQRWARTRVRQRGDEDVIEPVEVL